MRQQRRDLAGLARGASLASARERAREGFQAGGADQQGQVRRDLRLVRRARRPSAESSSAELLSLLGPGDGLCLDLRCGTGLYFDAIRASGRSVVGVDRSADQLTIAGRRAGQIIQADGAALPFADGVFPTVTALWMSTDVDDFGAVIKEAARVLRPGGLLVFYGVHPCFNGPCVEVGEAGKRIVHPTYRTAGWHESSPWWGADGIRSRVGMRHLPLASLLNAFIDAGLGLSRVVEPREEPVPFIVAVLARREE